MPASRQLEPSVNPVTTPRVLFTEQLGGLTLTIGQEWEGAGLYWQLDCPADRAWPLPRYSHRSSGRFYDDQHGEKIHGATLEDVIQTARRAARRFCGAEEPV